MSVVRSIDSAQVLALVGAQYGSEGKGVIAHHLANRFEVHVRTGGPNAGHTFVHEGQKYVARSLPVGWTNPDAFLFIGPGAVVDLDLLDEEINQAEAAGYRIRDRLTVDRHAHVIQHEHSKLEGGTSGEAHQLIGSTGEGVGACRMARINRRAVQSDQWPVALVGDSAKEVWVGDTAVRVNTLIRAGARVMLEGTQGSALSLTHGEWPYVTSHDTNAATLAADAGIPPQLVETLLVARTFPIRVAGNSGPLEQEVAWESLGLPPEHTTVTKKERRIGYWDWDLVEKAAMLNRPLGFALTFLDYWYPELAGVRDWGGLTDRARRKIEHIEQVLETPCLFVSSGPAGTPIVDVPLPGRRAAEVGA